ncbi:MAG: CDP-alcohol phosphatidyltransferase family protein [Promethearchaeota archaeon]
MPVMNFDEYYDKWLEDHAYGNSSVVKGWLKISFFICKHVFLPLKFTPLVIDFLSLSFSLLIAVIFSLFPYLDDFGLFISGFLIIGLLLSIGMMDNLDGMIARLTNKKSPRGSYQDLIFDRVIDGIIIISPVFSTYTKISSILFLLFVVFVFENLRSIHISARIPMFSTLAERHARLVFHIGYIGICCCGFYLVSLGHVPQVLIFEKAIHFWPNLDILYICLGLISLVAIVQLVLKIAKTKMLPLKLSPNEKSTVLNDEKEINEIDALNGETSREEFEEAYNNLISATYLHEYRIKMKRLGYFQGKKMNFITKNPNYLFLIVLASDFIFFLLLILKLDLEPLIFEVDMLYNVLIVVYFLLIMGNLKKILYYSGYKKSLSIHGLILFHLSDLVIEVLLLSILSFAVLNDYITQIYVIFCLIVQLCYTANILNQRRKVFEAKAYLSRIFYDIINLFSLLGILFKVFVQNIYCLVGFILLLLFALIYKIYMTNSSLHHIKNRFNLDD